MPFLRSLPLRFARNLDRADVNLAMRKWWKLGYHKQEGVITQSLSPFEQEIIAPLFGNFPYKLWDKYGRRWVKDIGPGLLACYGGMKWADWKYEQLIRECWD